MTSTRCVHLQRALLAALAVGVTACVAAPQPVEPPPVPNQSQCPAGFGPLADDPLIGGCYLALADADWNAGEDACEAFDSDGITAHMVVVDRPAEHQALSDMAAGTLTGLWIGRFQRTPKEDFRNINYIEYDPEYWGSGEPNDYGEDCDLFGCTGIPGYGDERCVEYNIDTRLWNDKGCWRSDAVVCEWDGVPPYDWRPPSPPPDQT